MCTRGLSPDFELARQVLLHNDEQAIVMMHDLLADGVISQTDVDSWQLFDRLRSTGALSP
jgi:hypothetical protein